MIIQKIPSTDLFYSILEKLDGAKLYESGGKIYAAAVCPYHQSEPVRSSMFVYVDGHDFKCKSCGKYGSLEVLAAKLSGKSIRPVDTVSTPRVPFLKWLRTYGSYEEASNQAYLTAQNQPYLMSYFVQRKLVQYVDKGHFGWLDGYYSFPVYSPEGEFVDWVVRTSPKKKNIDSKYAVCPHKKDEPNHLYSPSWKRVAKKDVIYVCYGMLDSWTLYAAGVASITPITGQTVNTSMFSDIRKRIIVIPDDGELVSGRKFVSELGWRGRLLSISWPDKTKDLQDVHMKYGIEAVQELIKI